MTLSRGPQRYTPELGQAVFGAPWGEFEAPPFVEVFLTALGEAIAEQTNGYNPTGNYGETFVNDTFEMRSYCWQDCDCGFDEKDWEWSEGRDHASGCFHTRYEEAEKRLGADNYAKGWEKRHERLVLWARENGYLAAPNGMAVYCDCGLDDEYVAWRQTNDHGPDCAPCQPNFRFGDFEVRWYKWVGRGTTVNRPIERSEMLAIVQTCTESLAEVSQ